MPVLDRQAEKAGEIMSPYPLSSILKTSTTEDFSRLRILHVPFPRMILFSPVKGSVQWDSAALPYGTYIQETLLRSWYRCSHPKRLFRAS